MLSWIVVLLDGHFVECRTAEDECCGFFFVLALARSCDPARPGLELPFNQPTLKCSDVVDDAHIIKFHRPVAVS